MKRALAAPMYLHTYVPTAEMSILACFGVGEGLSPGSGVTRCNMVHTACMYVCRCRYICMCNQYGYTLLSCSGRYMPTSLALKTIRQGITIRVCQPKASKTRPLAHSLPRKRLPSSMYVFNSNSPKHARSNASCKSQYPLTKRCAMSIIAYHVS